MPQIHDILYFLQSALDLGLRVSSLRVKTSALSLHQNVVGQVIHWWCSSSKGQSNSDLRRSQDFLSGIYLSYLLSAPTFGQSQSASIRDLSIKLAFLVAITYAKRVSKIGAFGCKEPFLTFFPDRVVLIPMLDSNS